MNQTSRDVLERALSYKKLGLKQKRERRAELAADLRNADASIADTNREIFALEADLA